MRTFDPNRPYQEVVGGAYSRVKYIQDGDCYSAAREYLGPESGAPAVEVPEADEVSGTSASAEATAEKASASSEERVPYDKMHHLALRAEVMRRGGSYKDKKSAILWLKMWDESHNVE